MAKKNMMSEKLSSILQCLVIKKLLQIHLTKKQIITFTHPHIGNTGTNKEDSESEMIHASGIVVKNFVKNLLIGDHRNL